MKSSQEFKSKKQFRKICELAIRYEFCYCYLCGNPILPNQKWNLDHIRPRSKGGKTIPDNLRPTHKSCNESKKDMFIGEYRQIRQLILNQRENQK